MIVNYYFEQEQAQRELEALNAIEEQLDENSDIYEYGEFDALIGAEPDPKWASNPSYRRGYIDSFWHFYDQKYGIKLDTEF